jgi:CelD/BcsL family acetyltransferase involved in cellulose biosynthesis
MPRETSNSYRLEIIPFHPGLWEDLRPAWCALLEQRPDAAVFLSPAWIETWLAVYGASLQPQAVMWRDDSGAPVAACLLTLRWQRRVVFPVRSAYVNATGEHEVGSEHNRILCSPQAEQRIVKELVDFVLRRDAQLLCLNGFCEDAATAIQAAWPAATHAELLASEDPFVHLEELRGKRQPFLANLSRNTREKIRRSIRLYEERFGQIRLDLARDSAEALDWLANLRSLHDARWRARGLSGAFGTPSARSFHDTVVGKLTTTQKGDSPVIDMIRVSAGDTAIGFLYNLRYRGAVSFYQSGFVYDDDQRLKPGLVTHSKAIEHYLETDAAEYDFLAGEPESVQYKQSLATHSRRLHWLELSAPTVGMRLFNRLRQLRRRLRR